MPFLCLLNITLNFRGKMTIRKYWHVEFNKFYKYMFYFPPKLQMTKR